jgi:photosystem II stability/assembly factor-like uncharacterized protein
MRRFSFVAVVLFAVVQAMPASEVRHPEDAALRAVQFLDDREGWAVGDEGVVWHTMNGGKSWERQPTGVRASLRGLHFLNPCVGWVAGREEVPGGGSAGVVLYTRDGGVNWRRLLVHSLPGLHLVRFVDNQTGYLAGDGSEQFPSGVFATTDGGRSWEPVPGPRASSWRAGDFSPEGGALGGAWNHMGTVRRGKVFRIEQDTLGGRAVCGLQLRGDDGVAVGQGGLVLLAKKSRGSSWDYVNDQALNLPHGARATWDFHAVGGVGKHVWAVGRPGSAALYSPDLGKSWQVVRTGQPLPLHGIFFRDDKHGWAVGELGTIIATSDGGKTWQVQHWGGQRLAVLSVHGRPAGMPLDTVALVGEQDGYLTGGLCVTAPEPGTAALARVGETCRLQEAFRQAGGAVAEGLWQFPVGSHLARADGPTLLKAWDRLHGGSAAWELLGQLVLAIRMYKPEVLLTSGVRSQESGIRGADALVAEALKEAFRRAADKEAFAEQLTVLGLEPWQAKKLYTSWPAGGGAQVRHDLTAVSAPLGSTVREFATAPLALLGADAPPAQRGWKLLADKMEGAATHHDLMQGTSLLPGQGARRVLGPVEELSPEVLKAVQQRANLWAIAESPASTLTSPDRLLAQIGPALAEMPQEVGARVAQGLAWQYARKGQWALARETFLLLVERYPAHPLAIAAYRWLLQHSASSEARRRHELGQFLIVGEMQTGVPGEKQKLPEPAVSDPKKKGEKKKPKLPDVPSFSTASERVLTELGTKEDVRRWFQGTLLLGKKLSAFGPLYSHDPAVQFCLQSARRQLGDVKGALEWYRRFAAEQPAGPWKEAALAELWLANRSGEAPRAYITSRPTESRPYLDGKLNDDCWKQARPVTLKDASGRTRQTWPTEVRISHDREFLYVAVRCGHPAGASVPPAKVRTRDQDLRRLDRVSILLDLDRDYSTCFHLQIAANGCVAEDCWGDRTWDPRWFVAIHREENAWTAEAAIPRHALSADHITPGRTWAANVVRVLPGQGVQALSLPAEAPEEALRPEGLGLLLFTGDDQRQASETRKARATPAK